MSKLYLYNYNNYFNRIIKKEVDLASYGTPLYQLANTNFNYNDGVETSHDINYDKEEGDYVIVTEVIDNIETIISRWFVIETKRLRGGQHRLTLRRDLIVDNFDKVVNAPIILQKGMVKKENNLIFNKEGFNFNQIKKDVILLENDKNFMSWLYLYCAKNAGDIEASVQTSFTPSPDIDIQTDISNSIYANGEHIAHAQNISFLTYLRFYNDSNPRQIYEFYLNNSSIESDTSGSSNYIDLGSNYYTIASVKENLDTLVRPNYNTYRSSYIGQEPNTYLTEQQTQQLLNSNGKLLRDVNGNYYRISTTITYSTEVVDLEANNPISELILNQIKINYPNATIANGAIKVQYLKTTFVVSATPQTNIDYNVSIAQSEHQKTLDSECNIIAIPYGDFIVTNNDTPLFSVDKDSQLAIARALAQKGTTQKVYDMQLLPYGPFSDYCKLGNSIDISTMNDELYQIETYNNNPKNIIFYVEYANFNIDIEKTISIPQHSQAPNADINYKLVNECDIWRLCSPNFNGVFEFNVAKNRGINLFNVDMTLRPYNPYIHIKPEFNSEGLYGDNWNDARGLICGGDFSLPITGDAFTQYELSNKNYQIAFDRQIQNLEFTQGQEKTLALIEALTGTLTAGAGGVAGGLMASGPAGAMAGGLVAGGASLVGGLADIGMLSARQEEQKSYAIDNFKYRLGNIKALPYSLNKVNPLTLNNQIFPFIEYYSCTDEEKEALVNKIIYSGMTLNVIGTIANFKTNYGSNDKHFYRGELIRLEAINLPSHEAYEIYQEMEKGVYI